MITQGICRRSSPVSPSRQRMVQRRRNSSGPPRWPYSIWGTEPCCGRCGCFPHTSWKQSAPSQRWLLTRRRVVSISVKGIVGIQVGFVNRSQKLPVKRPTRKSDRDGKMSDIWGNRVPRRHTMRAFAAHFVRDCRAQHPAADIRPAASRKRRPRMKAAGRAQCNGSCSSFARKSGQDDGNFGMRRLNLAVEHDNVRVARDEARSAGRRVQSAARKWHCLPPRDPLPGEGWKGVEVAGTRRHEYQPRTGCGAGL
jgi:hypothetical protein